VTWEGKFQALYRIPNHDQKSTPALPHRQAVQQVVEGTDRLTVTQYHQNDGGQNFQQQLSEVDEIA